LQDLMSLNVDAATLVVTDDDGEHERVIGIDLVQRGDIIKVGGFCCAGCCATSTAVCNRCWLARSSRQTASLCTVLAKWTSLC
jgi:hypothetical protein